MQSGIQRGASAPTPAANHSVSDRVSNSSFPKRGALHAQVGCSQLSFLQEQTQSDGGTMLRRTDQKSLPLAVTPAQPVGGGQPFHQGLRQLELVLEGLTL